MCFCQGTSRDSVALSDSAASRNAAAGERIATPPTYKNAVGLKVAMKDELYYTWKILNTEVRATPLNGTQKRAIAPRGLFKRRLLQNMWITPSPTK